MKSSEALAKIRAALVAVTDWNGDPDLWPDVAVVEACQAVYELEKAYSSVGPARERPRPNEVATWATLTIAKLMHLGVDAVTDPVARMRLVASLGVYAIALVERPSDMGIKTSRSNQKKAQKLRKQSETEKLHRLAREVIAGWGRDDSSPHRGQKMTFAGIVREVGKRMYNSDDATTWPVSERALGDRLRKYVKTL